MVFCWVPCNVMPMKQRNNIGGKTKLLRYIDCLPLTYYSIITSSADHFFTLQFSFIHPNCSKLVTYFRNYRNVVYYIDFDRFQFHIRVATDICWLQSVNYSQFSPCHICREWIWDVPYQRTWHTILEIHSFSIFFHKLNLCLDFWTEIQSWDKESKD